MHFFYVQIDCKSTYIVPISKAALSSAIEYQASKGKTTSERHSLFSFVLYTVNIQQYNASALWLGFENTRNTEVKGTCSV